MVIGEVTQNHEAPFGIVRVFVTVGHCVLASQRTTPLIYLQHSGSTADTTRADVLSVGGVSSSAQLDSKCRVIKQLVLVWSSGFFLWLSLFVFAGIWVARNLKSSI